MSTAFRYFRQHWHDTAAIPMYVVVGAAVVAPTWYLARLARGSDIVWDRKGNPEPWRDVQPRQQTKMYTTAGAREHFDSQYSRSRL